MPAKKFTNAQAKAKLTILAEIEGFDTVEQLFEARVCDPTGNGICMNFGCSYTVEVEGDQDEGHCDECDEGSVVSPLVLGGLI